MAYGSFVAVAYLRPPPGLGPADGLRGAAGRKVRILHDLQCSRCGRHALPGSAAGPIDRRPVAATIEGIPR